MLLKSSKRKCANNTVKRNNAMHNNFPRKSDFPNNFIARTHPIKFL